MRETRYSRIHDADVECAAQDTNPDSPVPEGDTGGQPEHIPFELTDNSSDTSTTDDDDDSEDDSCSGSEGDTSNVTDERREELIRRKARKIDALYRKRKDATTYVAELDNEIQGEEENVKKWQLELEANKVQKDLTPVPTGPAHLRWVDGTVFNLFSSVIVITNIGVMAAQVSSHQQEEPLDPDQARLMWWMNQFFLIFYIIELVLRAMLFEREFLFGRCNVVWNWLDLIIVVGGIFDEWILPFLEIFGLISVRGTSLPYVLKGLRFLRIARILKVVRNILKSDLSWAEGEVFQVFMMGVIGLNCIVMGIETDMPNLPAWPFVDNIFLLIYSFELMVRIRHSGCGFFICGRTVKCADIAWNYLDFVIVLGGVVDQWLLPFMGILMSLSGNGNGTSVKAGLGSQSGQIMMLLRMARLLRLLRLIKLIRKIPDLYKLVVGIIQAMQGMFWVLVLTFVILYCFGLLCVKLFGASHALAWGGVEYLPDEYAGDEAFENLPSAMWVLFMTMNGDPSGLQTLFDVYPWAKLLCAIFMVISSWAILSILTAVVSENMINATERTEETNRSTEAKRDRRLMRKRLRRVFTDLDSSKNGWITVSEFNEAKHLHRKAIYKALKNMMPDDTDSNASPGKKETQREEKAVKKLDEIFSLLVKLKGVPGPTGAESEVAVRREDFIKGMQCEEQPPTRMEVLQLQARIVDSMEHMRSEQANSMRSEQGLLRDIEETVQKHLFSLEDRLKEFNVKAEEEMKYVSENLPLLINEAVEHSPTLSTVQAKLEEVAAQARRWQSDQHGTVDHKHEEGALTEPQVGEDEDQELQHATAESNAVLDHNETDDIVTVADEAAEAPNKETSLQPELGDSDVAPALSNTASIATEAAPLPTAAVASQKAAQLATSSKWRHQPQTRHLVPPPSAATVRLSRQLRETSAEGESPTSPPPSVQRPKSPLIWRPRASSPTSMAQRPSFAAGGQVDPSQPSQKPRSAGPYSATPRKPNQVLPPNALKAQQLQPQSSSPAVQTPSPLQPVHAEEQRSQGQSYHSPPQRSDVSPQTLDRSPGTQVKISKLGMQAMCCAAPSDIDDGSRSSREVKVYPLAPRQTAFPGTHTDEDPSLKEGLGASQASIAGSGQVRTRQSPPRTWSGSSHTGNRFDTGLPSSSVAHERQTDAFVSPLGSIKEVKMEIAAILQKGSLRDPLLSFQDLEQQRYQDLELLGATRGLGTRFGWAPPTPSDSSASQTPASRSMSQQLSPRSARTQSLS